MKTLSKYLTGDKWIWATVIALFVVSLLAVYSSTGTLAYRMRSGHTEYYLIKHLLIQLFGLVLMVFAHRINYRFFAGLSKILVAISIPLLLITLFTGEEINEANRWITLPVINLSFQSSDLAKLSLIMYVAFKLAKSQGSIKDFKTGFLPIVAPVIIICGLILPANFSTAALLFVVCLVMMFIGRVNMKYIVYMMGIGIASFMLLVAISKVAPDVLPRMNTWLARAEAFFSPSGGDEDQNYQVTTGKMAIKEGGVFGKGPGGSEYRDKIPHPYSDWIFSIIVEEYGLIGGLSIVFAYLFILYRCVRIVLRAQGTFGALLTFGAGFAFVAQALINMGVVVKLLPATGQPLPLVSMGGTSIWFSSISIGLILSVSRETEKQKSIEGGSDEKA